jgi:hypothetical protein
MPETVKKSSGILSGVLGGLGGVVGGIASLWQNKQNSDMAQRNTDATNAANMNLAKYQYSTDVDMWNKANDYNSPKSQMGRFKEAGLNPNLIYGQGTSGNTATTLPKYQAPSIKYDYQPKTNLPETLSVFQNFLMRQAQTDNLREQKELINAQTELSKMNRLLTGVKLGDMTNTFDAKWWDPNTGIKQRGGALQPAMGSIGYRGMKSEMEKTQFSSVSESLRKQLLKLDLDFYTKNAWARYLNTGASVIGKVK